MERFDHFRTTYKEHRQDYIVCKCGFDQRLIILEIDISKTDIEGEDLKCKNVVGLKITEGKDIDTIIRVLRSFPQATEFDLNLDLKDIDRLYEKYPEINRATKLKLSSTDERFDWTRFKNLYELHISNFLETPPDTLAYNNIKVIRCISTNYNMLRMFDILEVKEIHAMWLMELDTGENSPLSKLNMDIYIHGCKIVKKYYYMYSLRYPSNMLIKNA